MRKFTLIFISIFFLSTLMVKGQSISIDQFYAEGSTGPGNCTEVGDTVFFQASGTASNLNTNDTLFYHVNMDDGSGFQQEGASILGSANTFFFSFQKLFNQSGTFNVQLAVVDPNGPSDTASFSVTIADSCTSISGRVYVDSNNNCTYDAGEPVANNRVVKLFNSNNNQLAGYAHTDATGQYEFIVAPGVPYTISMQDTGLLTNQCNPSGTINVSSYPSSGNNFGLNCTSGNDFGISHLYPSTGTFRPNMVRWVHFNIEGMGYCNDDSLSCIKLILDQYLQPDSSSYPSTPPSPQYTSVNGDTVIWNMQQTTYQDFSYAAVPIFTTTDAVIDDTLCMKMVICTNNDSNPTNDTIKRCFEVVNSYDPNKKEVGPTGLTKKGYIQNNQTMTYTVHFQNTGTAPAFNVRVEDTLDSDLNANSLQVLSSSHSMTTEIENNNIIKFKFNNINLPDSNANEPESHGYVRFQIDQKQNLPIGTKIRNSAAIFFDQNPPIITNEVVNTIGIPKMAEAQIIHNSADTAVDSVDVWINGNKEVTGLAYHDATPFMEFQFFDTVNIGIAKHPSSSISDTLKNFTFANLSDNGDYILVANGIVSSSAYNPAPELDLNVKSMARKEANSTGNVVLLVNHGVTDGPTIDIIETQPGSGTVINNLSYKEFAGYLSVPTANYEIEVKDTSSGQTIGSFDAPFSDMGLGDSAVTIVASGFMNPGQNNNGPSFGLFLTAANGGNMTELTHLTSISENSLADHFEIYPNPTTDQVKVEWENVDFKRINIKLLDASGKVISKQKIEGGSGHVIDFRNYKQGIYFMQIKMDGKRMGTRKIIKN